MATKRVLIANRGEVAARVARSVRQLGWVSVGLHGSDEPNAPHLRLCDETFELSGTGASAFLRPDAISAAAVATRSDLVHPGYGFLAESAELAESCLAASVGFAGPGPDVLRRLGDKVAAREFAEQLGVPVLPGRAVASAADAAAFQADELGGTAMVLKAAGGGGGRGLRVVPSGGDVATLFDRARSEATAAFGRGELYGEALLEAARHVEIQVAGDGSRCVSLGERECTLQRRFQKLVEMAPSPTIDDEARSRLGEWSTGMARELGFRGLVTFEYIVDSRDPDRCWFIEANARLQVEHTVTEQVLGLDLVRLQLLLADGSDLEHAGLREVPPPRGAALQVRVNTEAIRPDGSVHPRPGRVTAITLPAGPGVRCDTAARAGTLVDARFDSMILKIIGHGADHDDARLRVVGALDELAIEGVETNASFLSALLCHPDVVANRVSTTSISAIAPELVTTTDRAGPASGAPDSDDPEDPLAVLRIGHAGPPTRADAPGTLLARSTPSRAVSAPVESEPVVAPLAGTVVTVAVAPGDLVAAGTELVIVEAMKMEHVVAAPAAGMVSSVAVADGEPVTAGQVLLYLEPGSLADAGPVEIDQVDLDEIRPDLRLVLDRHAIGEDSHRPEKVQRRHERGGRTARENVADLVDAGSFVEYGPLVVAAQRRRRSLDDLIENTPADGLVGGLARINGDLFEGHAGQAVVMSYDYMVLAGTQGLQNHRKKDRLLEIAERQRLPVVVFTEGGGGRPGDTDTPGGSGLDCLAFLYFAGLSGRIPLIGINNGPCFAGNAALLGCCDVVIATASSSIGMGGPAMIEGGGLGMWHPSEVGPMSVQVANGVVDIAVEDEAEAVAVAKQYLTYFQGTVAEWECDDQRLLRHLVPENRLRVYEVRRIIEGLFDTGSVLELRRGWGHGMVTALARIEGRPLGVIANDPEHLSGAIDSNAADKASRFMQLCDAHGLPIVMLCDTPGIMVGPEAEKQATVRHAARMFVTGASLQVPFMTIVLRKAYGLGAQAMAGASFRAGLFTVAWPTGEFGGMGLEGAVKLGYRKELEALTDPAERQQRFEEMVAHLYDVGRAVSNATTFEIDDVIDPLDSRRWITTALRSTPPPDHPPTARRPMIDTW